MLYNNPKPQDTKEGLSDQDFSIYMDAHTVPFSKYPSYMPAGVLGICTEGNAEIQVG
ncbi:AraC family transcriptional regulator, partial [Phocaeicola vulgatus]